MTLLSFLPLLAGLGLFLFGMSMMGSSLEKIAGSRMENTLERLTSTRLSGVMLGVAVTAVIQSSSATTVMVVGFVNAGIMKLSQAVTVIMGANIGTTVTAQIIRLSEVGSTGSTLLALLKPSSFAPILVIIGAAMLLFFGNKRVKDYGSLIFGFGALFFGMSVMEQTLKPLQDSELLRNAFSNFENPLWGILVGTGVTALIQSSSASVGILQALSTTGAISFSMMVPIILGQNIGTCVTVLLASIGANRNAKRAAMLHLLFNLIGTFIFFCAIYGYNALFGIPFFENKVNMGDIANFHTIFNLVNTVLLFPFCNYIVKAATFLIRDKDSQQAEEDNLLGDLFLATPSVAVEQSRKMTLRMGQVAAENVKIAHGLIKSYDRHAMARLDENEHFCDKTESKLSEYLLKVTAEELSAHDSRQAAEMFHTISDFERISDRAVNIAEVARYNMENSISFSKSGIEEIDLLGTAVQEILEDTIKAYTSMDVTAAYNIEPLEEVIDILTEALKNKHVERLQTGLCTIPAGISFLELLSNYERIADHCSNIAIYIVQAGSEDSYFDPHEHIKELHASQTDSYKRAYAHYEDKYFKPVANKK